MRRVLAVSVLLGLAAGCGRPPHPPPAADPERARGALQATLDAWKKGDSPESLAEAKPSVRVADEDWHGGCRLLAYEVKDAGRVVGRQLRCTVILSLQQPGGKPVRRKAVYSVDTEPALSVVREEN